MDIILQECEIKIPETNFLLYYNFVRDFLRKRRLQQVWQADQSNTDL